MKNKEKTLVKNTTIILISKIFTQFLSLLLLPLLTKALSTEQYGSFDLITTYSWLAAGFISFQVENGIFRFLIDSRNNEEETKKIITNGLLSILILYLIFSAIYLPIFHILKINNYLYVYLYAVSTLLLNIPLQISRGLGDNTTYSIASVLTGLFNILLSFISLYVFHLGLLGLISSAILSNIIGGLYAFFKKKMYKYIRFQNKSKKTIKDIIKYSSPLLPNSISSWIMNISDKAMLAIFRSTSATGIYSISTKFPVLLSHFYSVFNLSWSESASVNVKEEDKEEFFSKAINKIFVVCSSTCLIIMAFMPIIFRIMIDEKFFDSYNYIPILILASIFELFTILLGGIYISLKLSKNVAITTMIASCFNIIINLIFMKKYGIIVACLSTLISYAILAIVRIIDIRKHIHIRIDKKIFGVIVVLYLILTILYYNKCLITEIIMMILSLLSFVVLNRYLIKNCLNSCIGLIKKYKKRLH